MQVLMCKFSEDSNGCNGRASIYEFQFDADLIFNGFSIMTGAGPRLEK